MHSFAHYLALSVLLLPVSALLAVLLVSLARRWQRRLTRGLGNRYRDESWHTIHPGSRLQTRTRR